MSTEKQEVRMVFDAPPGRDMPTLVEIEDQSGRAIDIGESVSYTHLTLPTIYSV